METESTSSFVGAASGEFAAHMHIVFSVVADFMRRVPRSVQREDLVAAGSVGLLHALRSNKHTCPEMFNAYARIRVRGAILDELRRHDWSPRRRRTGAASDGAPSSDAGGDKRGVVVIGFDDLLLAYAPVSEAPSPLDQVEKKRSSAKVRSAVDELPPRERMIVRMRYFDDVPSKAIASALGLSEARISQLLTRATSQLKQLLVGRGAELAHAA